MIKALLAEAVSRLAANSTTARLDAEVLLSHVLKKPRTYLRAWPDSVVAGELESAFNDLLTQRNNGMPIAYLTGQREFWSREFRVTRDVLIPRPETELLIEIALELIADNRPVKIIDLGTGSGIVACTLALELPIADITATDISAEALNIAQGNAERLGAKNIRFIQSDWFSSVPDQLFDLIVSNPPYIAQNDRHLREGDLRFEPPSALSAPEDGLADLRRIADSARHYLYQGGTLLLEHGYQQQQRVQPIFTEMGYDSIQPYRDLAGNARAISGRYHGIETK